MKKILLSILTVSGFALSQPSVTTCLKALDDMQQMTTDVSADVIMTQQKVNQGAKKMESKYFRRDKDDAFLIVMSSPESDKGNGYLRVDDNFWMYRKNTRTFQHINRDESIGGSDAKADDFEGKKIIEQYEGLKTAAGTDSIAQEMLGKIPVYKFEVKAKVKDVDYPRKIYWVRTDTYIPLKEQSYSSSNTLMQTAYYLKYTQISGKYVPVNQIFIDEFEKGNKTMVEISNISTKKIDDALFTKAYLENLSK